MLIGQIVIFISYFFLSVCMIDGISGGPSHPVHLHGNHFHVLKYGSGEINKTTGYTQGPTQDIQFSSDFRSAQWRNSSWNFGNVPGINIENPPKKDTIMVPFRGYVIIRFRTDNPGSHFVKICTEKILNCAIFFCKTECGFVK